jgi:hypothetical protein
MKIGVVPVNDIVLQLTMDIIKEEPDWDEGSFQVPALKEEPLIDIKCEEQYDPISPAVIVTEDMVSYILI